MFRIRRVIDDAAPNDRDAIAQVQEILRRQFPGVKDRDVGRLAGKLRDPLKYRFRSLLYVAEGGKGIVKGFALVLHAPDLGFCFLDFLSVAPQGGGRGVGGGLYERVRSDARALGVCGLFLECLPDDPALCSDPAVCRQNAARLRFYERYGARPIANTAYETPVNPGDDCPPYLVYDPLDGAGALACDKAQAIVRAILERKYKAECPPAYVEKVVASIRDDPVRVREPRYTRKPPPPAPRTVSPHVDQAIALIVNDAHEIHHVRERGYVESPARVGAILREIEALPMIRRVKAQHFSERHIRAVHDPVFVGYLRRACQRTPAGKSLYPYVFPIRNAARPPVELTVRAGYFCIDTFTPLNRNAYPAARGAVDCAMTGARLILEGCRLAYALVRPPGHHAEPRAFGGFCYFNSAAIAAHHLSARGKVAVLDIDYHHGNGIEEIFYDRADVLTISIHGHPRFAYPYFSGFKDDRGCGDGRGFNLNIPLREHVDGARYRRALARALARIRKHKPAFVVVGLGLDTAKGDPTGTWSLRAPDFAENGRMIGRLGLPALVVQEGGYHIRSLGINARHFLVGLWDALRMRGGV